MNYANQTLISNYLDIKVNQNTLAFSSDEEKARLRAAHVYDQAGNRAALGISCEQRKLL